MNSYCMKRSGVFHWTANGEHKRKVVVLHPIRTTHSFSWEKKKKKTKWILIFLRQHHHRWKIFRHIHSFKRSKMKKKSHFRYSSCEFEKKKSHSHTMANNRKCWIGRYEWCLRYASNNTYRRPNKVAKISLCESCTIVQMYWCIMPIHTSPSPNQIIHSHPDADTRNIRV